MNNQYDIHAWSRQYREEALRVARSGHRRRSVSDRRGWLSGVRKRTRKGGGADAAVS